MQLETGLSLFDCCSANKSSFLPPHDDILHTCLYLPPSKRRGEKKMKRERGASYVISPWSYGRRSLHAEERGGLRRLSAREKRETYVGVGSTHWMVIRVYICALFPRFLLINSLLIRPPGKTMTERFVISRKARSIFIERLSIIFRNLDRSTWCICVSLDAIVTYARNRKSNETSGVCYVPRSNFPSNIYVATFRWRSLFRWWSHLKEALADQTAGIQGRLRKRKGAQD